jgi:hypothetical protein
MKNSQEAAQQNALAIQLALSRALWRAQDHPDHHFLSFKRVLMGRIYAATARHLHVADVAVYHTPRNRSGYQINAPPEVILTVPVETNAKLPAKPMFKA